MHSSRNTSETAAVREPLQLLGRPCADEINEAVAARVSTLKQAGVIPGLALVMMGDDPLTHRQIDLKKAAAQQAGFYAEKHVLPEMASQTALDDLLNSLSKRERIHGIFVQLPLPRHINRDETGRLVNDKKDIDLFNPESLGDFYIGHSRFQPALPLAVLRLLKFYGIKISGSDISIAGLGLLGSQPLTLMLLRERATVTVCNPNNDHIKEKLSSSQIVVASVDEANFIRWDMVADDAVVIDLGQNLLHDRIVGDVDAKAVREKASAMTPVPGGVGPVIVSVILENCISAAEAQTAAKPL